MNNVKVRQSDKNNNGTFSQENFDPAQMNSEKELAKLKSDLAVLKAELNTLKNKFIGSELQIQSHGALLHHITSDTKTGNKIIIHGLRGLNNLDIKNEVINFFSDILQIQPTVYNAEVILSRKKLTYNPVLVTFESINDKILVFANCHKLKHLEDKISVWDDIPSHERKKRKLAVLEMKKLKNFGENCKIFGSRLIKNVKKILPTPHGMQKTPIIFKPFQPNVMQEITPTINNLYQPNVKQVPAECVEQMPSKFAEQQIITPTSHLTEFKQDLAVQLVLSKMHKNRLSGENRKYDQLLKLIATQRKAKFTSAKCRCNTPDKPNAYNNFIEETELDFCRAISLIEKVNEIRSLFSQMYKSRYKNYCLCGEACVEEMLLDEDFMKLCNTERIRPPSPETENKDKMFGNLFEE
ncbi:hypothetical protein Fcan01_25965 [Folsomia candida]|uniref:Uncharacterized protein n=1 Tax=Folsomia candida TaxID=158441 RepID=A0A226D2C0_FOLCA|nr:hypothetical protein Fcan01_25965 [Folsomia candida]